MLVRIVEYVKTTRGVRVQTVSDERRESVFNEHHGRRQHTGRRATRQVVVHTEFRDFSNKIFFRRTS